MDLIETFSLSLPFMKIRIDHIAKIEGHAGFVASILDGNVRKAKIEIQEGAKLIEGILIGRRFWEAPIITARICGLCPVAHNLTALKALEAALGIKVSNQTIMLRKLMLAGQIIHSHSLHLFFLSLPDFFNLENDLKLIKKYPKETKAALRIRNFGTKIIKTIGGRIIHPITSEIGGFKKLPSKNELLNLIRNYEEVWDSALILSKLFKKIKCPKFERKTEYISLGSKKEYAFYDGAITSNQGLKISPEKFEQNIKEIQKPYQVVKEVDYSGKTFMVGALSRINNNYQFLNQEAKKIWEDFNQKIPVYNIFYNIFAQAIEIIHFIEESKKIIDRLSKMKLKDERKRIKIKTGRSTGATEAPRGTLYHFYSLDREGRILDCNIITPTAQFLTNLEEDLRAYLPNVLSLPSSERKRKIKAFIRAYDPCISCAVH